MAAKQISQQTFDDVVRENISDFEMSPEEAVEDAVKQFESQEVNLSIIIKEPALYINADKGANFVHPALVQIQRLTKAVDDGDDPSILDSLQLLQKECDLDLAHRCLAGSNGGFPAVLKAMQKHKDTPEQLTVSLSTLNALCKGQPDLIDNEGKACLIDLLQRHRERSEMIELVVRAIRYNCIKHEENRQDFVGLNLIGLLTDMMRECRASAGVVKETCSCLRALTQDDDVRVPFGKAHDTAKMIVTEGDGLTAVCDLCEDYKNDSSVLGELFLTLSCLAVRNEFCQEVMDRGGVKFIINAFRLSMTDKNIVRHAFIVLKSLSGNDEVKSEVARLGGIPLVVEAMNQNQANGPVAEGGCRVLTAVTLRNEDNCSKVMECHGHQQIVQAMKLHPNNPTVQKQACMALRNLVSRTKEFIEPILELGCEPLLNLAMNTHKDVFDEAKAALRDLGCQVTLTCLWTGKNGVMQMDAVPS